MKGKRRYSTAFDQELRYLLYGKGTNHIINFCYNMHLVTGKCLQSECPSECSMHFECKEDTMCYLEVFAFCR